MKLSQFPPAIAADRRIQVCIVFAATWAGHLVLAEKVRCAEDSPTDTDQTRMVDGTPIEQGFVIVDGQCLPPPYIIDQRGEELFIGERNIPTGPLLARSGRNGAGFRRGDDPDRTRGPMAAWDDPTTRLLSRLERQLANNALLLISGQEWAHLASVGDTPGILQVLISNAASDRKVTLIRRYGIPDWIRPAQLRQLVDEFESTPEFTQRIEDLIEEHGLYEVNASWTPPPDKWAVADDLRNRHQWYALLSSKPVSYGITVMSMAIAVIATGTLIMGCPQSRGRWRETNDAPEERDKVRANVVLLSLLGCFDLLLTLTAQQTGGLMELNPLGSQLISSPLLLTGFKLISLLLVCLILFRLRAYRGAQLASWWMCLVCTILMYRWVTFNSLFMI
jgi:hypothetical protein